MRDQFSEAVEELETKSPFICASCGHPNKIDRISEQPVVTSGEGVKDRFSKAIKESGEKSAFVCESCGHRQSIPSPSKH